MYIIRDSYLKRFRQFYNTPVIKVLTGIRRSGKSYLLKMVCDDLLKMGVLDSQILSINFESLSESFVRDVDKTYEHIKQFTDTHEGKSYFFFDEIQQLKEWERLVNSLQVDFDCDIYITGSNATLLSGELATHIGGRYVEFSIYPLSFKEIINNCNISDEHKAFQDYLVWGGFPFLYSFNLDSDGKESYLSSIFDSIIMKDIVTRNNIRDVDLLKRLIVYMMENIGRLFSSQSVVKYLKSEQRKLSNETLYNYIDYCRQANLLLLIPRYNIQGKKLLKVGEKIYLSDTGLREVVYGNNERDIELVLENIVCLELFRRGYQVFVGQMNNQEVDFIAKNKNQTMYIQVAYLLASQETIDREFSSLEQIHDNFPKYVLTLDSFQRSRNGIIHMNIKDFLLNDLV